MKWIIALNIKGKGIKLLEENIEENCGDCGRVRLKLQSFRGVYLHDYRVGSDILDKHRKH